MYKLKNSFITLGGLLILIGVIALITPFKGYSQQSPAAVSDVKVVNTVSFPVQSKIINATSSPVNVRSVESVGLSILKTLEANFPTGGGFATLEADTTNYVVPPGKRLVIEHVSAQGELPSSQRLVSIQLIIKNSSNVQTGYHYLPTPDGKTFDFSSTDFFNLSQPLRLYVDPGFKISFHATRNAGGTIGSIRFAFSGYLVSVP